ncbi:MAG: ATP-binding cassette domain-containing protein, partial [Hyphomicrobiales bacterium]|nr:ATP-binding cassette domain-containing protein [Hyphomicrobiales bacterium]
MSAGARAAEVEAIGMSMRFGRFVALDDVSIKVAAGSFHALLGENGAGKSTLVKCIMGYQRPSAGQLLVDGREAAIGDPRDAAALGLGMVYQHFTVAPSLTAAENLAIARRDAPGILDWAAERARLADFMARMPFKLPLDLPTRALSAGERQKLEILKQLYLGRRFLVLDEPTSVLTPDEADEALGLVRALTREGSLTALMITHKFDEVSSFADEVTVLRRGRRVGSGKASELARDELARMMMGDQPLARPDDRAPVGGGAVLEVLGAEAPDRTGT